MAVDDGVHIRPHLVDFAVNEALQKQRPVFVPASAPIKIKLDHILRPRQRGRERFRHEEAVGRCGVAHRQVTEGVKHILGGADAAADGDILAQLRRIGAA